MASGCLRAPGPAEGNEAGAGTAAPASGSPGGGEQTSTRDRPTPWLHPSGHLGWLGVLLVGFGLWAGSAVVTAVTADVLLLPTVVLLGSFLVPVTAVIWYLDHYESRLLTGRAVVYAFIVGGVLGVLSASVLETALLGRSLLSYLGVGLIEEMAKLAALVFVARRLAARATRDGVVLGAAVGFGFAALESSGYAFVSLLVPLRNGIGLSLLRLVSTELVRAGLAPFGHGLWTAILGGVLFAGARGGRLRFTWPLALAYLLMALLHALWDAMQTIAALLTALISGTPLQRLTLAAGRLPRLHGGQLGLYAALQYGGLALITLVAVLILRRIWLRGGSAAGGAGGGHAAGRDTLPTPAGVPVAGEPPAGDAPGTAPALPPDDDDPGSLRPDRVACGSEGPVPPADAGGVSGDATEPPGVLADRGRLR